MSSEKKFRIQNGLDVAGEVFVNGINIVGADGVLNEASYQTAVQAMIDATVAQGVDQGSIDSAVSTAVAVLADSAPATLDTLNELAAALGNDADFATSMTNALNTKLTAANNLSDVADAAAARSNLGLGTAATSAITSFATAAQGAKADTAAQQTDLDSLASQIAADASGGSSKNFIASGSITSGESVLLNSSGTVGSCGLSATGVVGEEVTSELMPPFGSNASTTSTIDMSNTYNGHSFTKDIVATCQITNRSVFFVSQLRQGGSDYRVQSGSVNADGNGFNFGTPVSIQGSPGGSGGANTSICFSGEGDGMFLIVYSSATSYNDVSGTGLKATLCNVDENGAITVHNSYQIVSGRPHQSYGSWDWAAHMNFMTYTHSVVWDSSQSKFVVAFGADSNNNQTSPALYSQPTKIGIWAGGYYGTTLSEDAVNYSATGIGDFGGSQVSFTLLYDTNREKPVLIGNGELLNSSGPASGRYYSSFIADVDNNTIQTPALIENRQGWESGTLSQVGAGKAVYNSTNGTIEAISSKAYSATSRAAATLMGFYSISWDGTTVSSTFRPLDIITGLESDNVYIQWKDMYYEESTNSVVLAYDSRNDSGANFTLRNRHRSVYVASVDSSDYSLVSNFESFDGVTWPQDMSGGDASYKPQHAEAVLSWVPSANKFILLRFTYLQINGVSNLPKNQENQIGINLTQHVPISTASSAIGFAQDTVTSGGEVTVMLGGGVSETHTGLTVGSEYFIQEDGTISTTTTPILAGLALSATELQVADLSDLDNVNLSPYATTSSLTSTYATKAYADMVASQAATGVNFTTEIANARSGAVADVAASDLDLNGNKVLFANVYSTLADLPSASTYHGMFAHVHATGKGYFAHAGNWVELANTSDLLTQSDIDTAVANLVDTAPDALNTLNELAAALGDDANFASTVTASLADKATAADLTALELQLSNINVGTKDFTVNGTITVGQPVTLLPNGDVAFVAAPSISENTKTTTTHSEVSGMPQFEGQNLAQKFEYVSDNTYVTGGKVNNQSVLVLMTADSTSVSYGTPVVVNSTAGTSCMALAYNTVSNIGVVLYMTGGNFDPIAMKSFTISGSTITLSSETVLSNSNRTMSALNIMAMPDGSFFGTHIGWSNGGQGGTIFVVDSTGSISYSQQPSGWNSNASAAFVGYNPTYGKVYVAWQRGTSPFGTSIACADWNSGSPSFDGNSETYSTAIPQGLEYNPVKDKLTICLLGISGDPHQGMNSVGSVSTNGTVSVEHASNKNKTDAYGESPMFINAEGVVNVMHREHTVQGSQNGFGWVSFTDGTFGETSTFYSDPDDVNGDFRFKIGVNPNGGTVCHLYNTTDGGGLPNGNNWGAAFTQMIIESVITPSASNFVGISNASVTSAIAEVVIAGGLSTNHTGLSVGSSYYVQSDGSLSTTSSSIKAGTAIDATTILVSDHLSDSTDLSDYATKAYVDSGVAGVDLSGYTDTSGMTAAIAAIPATDLTPYSTTAEMDSSIATAKSEAQSYADQVVAATVDAAPAALDTLNELAAALGDDANFASTMTTSLASKADAATMTSALADKADASAVATTAQGVLADTAIQPEDLTTGFGTNTVTSPNFGGSYTNNFVVPNWGDTGNGGFSGFGFNAIRSNSTYYLVLGSYASYNPYKNNRVLKLLQHSDDSVVWSKTIADDRQIAMNETHAAIAESDGVKIYDMAGNLVNTITTAGGYTTVTNQGMEFFGDNGLLLGDAYPSSNWQTTGRVFAVNYLTGQDLGTINLPVTQYSPNNGISETTMFAVSPDQSKVYIGDWRSGTQDRIGRVYVADLSTFTVTDTIDNPTQTKEEDFGMSVAVNSEYLVVGRNNKPTGSNNNKGALEVYTVSDLNHVGTLEFNQNSSQQVDYGLSSSFNLSLIHI